MFRVAATSQSPILGSPIVRRRMKPIVSMRPPPFYVRGFDGRWGQEIFAVWSEKLTVTLSDPSITVHGMILKVRVP